MKLFDRLFGKKLRKSASVFWSDGKYSWQKTVKENKQLYHQMTRKANRWYGGLYQELKQCSTRQPVSTQIAQEEPAETLLLKVADIETNETRSSRRSLGAFEPAQTEASLKEVLHWLIVQRLSPLEEEKIEARKKLKMVREADRANGSEMRVCGFSIIWGWEQEVEGAFRRRRFQNSKLRMKVPGPEMSKEAVAPSGGNFRSSRSRVWNFWKEKQHQPLRNELLKRAEGNSGRLSTQRNIRKNLIVTEKSTDVGASQCLLANFRSVDEEILWRIGRTLMTLGFKCL